MGDDYMRCPKCGGTVSEVEVEVIYPRTDEREERRVKVYICQHCLFVFNTDSFRNENQV
jgi:uncharacterized protein with PIN domain